ncbi:hypothetical protein TeGR_g754, partial [Tetraparma gracilis]
YLPFAIYHRRADSGTDKRFVSEFYPLQFGKSFLPDTKAAYEAETGEWCNGLHVPGEIPAELLKGMTDMLELWVKDVYGEDAELGEGYAGLYFPGSRIWWHRDRPSRATIRHSLTVGIMGELEVQCVQSLRAGVVPTTVYKNEITATQKNVGARLRVRDREGAFTACLKG